VSRKNLFTTSPRANMHILRPAPLAFCLAVILAAASSPHALGVSRTTPHAVARERGSDFAYRGAPLATRSLHRAAGTLPVTSCADDNSAGTLRTVLASAADGDTVDLSSLTCGTITLALGAVQTAVDNVTIQGPGRDQLTIDAAHLDRAVVLAGAGTLSIADVTIVNGHLPGDYNGGCVRSYGNLSLTRTTVSGCEIVAVGYAAGGGAAARANMSLVDSTISGNSVSSSSNYYGYLYGGGVNAVGTMTITGSTISGNTQQFLGDVTPYSIAYGAGMASRSDTTISASTIDGNTGSTYGGGVFVVGQSGLFTRLTILRSTISGNAASLGGGGVSIGGLFDAHLSSFVLHGSTIADNTTDGAGGGLRFRDYTIADVQSTIVASNVAASNADLDAVETLAIYGADNLIDVADPDVALPADTLHGDPLLEPLTDNGGPTRTHALAAGSPAIDAGNNYFDDTFDQRGDGFMRVANGRADIGAFEVQPGDRIFADGFDGS
jgi:hypothetical protein